MMAMGDTAKRHELGMIHGRFHPFHNEHLRYFRWAWELCEHVIIGITNPDPSAIVTNATSAHRHRAQDNPFTYFERMMMIREGLQAEAYPLDRILFVPFPIHHPERWRHYVPEETTHFVTVYSPWEQQKADRLRAAGLQVSVRDSLDKTISGQRIRELLATDGDWEPLVPRGVAAYLRRHRGSQ